jgi:hypothetical protein
MSLEGVWGSNTQLSESPTSLFSKNFTRSVILGGGVQIVKI